MLGRLRATLKSDSVTSAAILPVRASDDKTSRDQEERSGIRGRDEVMEAVTGDQRMHDAVRRGHYRIPYFLVEVMDELL